MPVPVMDIRVMRMGVDRRRVFMKMSMRLAGTDLFIVGMGVMFVMDMAVFMGDFLMGMLVNVPF